MAHVRQSIRDNVVTAVTGLSTTGSKGSPLKDAKKAQFYLGRLIQKLS